MLVQSTIGKEWHSILQTYHLSSRPKKKCRFTLINKMKRLKLLLVTRSSSLRIFLDLALCSNFKIKIKVLARLSLKNLKNLMLTKSIHKSSLQSCQSSSQWNMNKIERSFMSSKSKKWSLKRLILKKSSRGKRSKDRPRLPSKRGEKKRRP